MRVLVGGVGYRNLRDHSAGLTVAERLMDRSWPAGVAVEDLSYNPIAVVQRLEDDPPEGRFERAVLVGAVSRPGRPPGTIEAYRWDGALPDAEHIQAAVAEGVTGVISLDNMLVIARHFRALPEETLIVEIEPELEEFGDEMSAAVARALPDACAIVAELATQSGASERLPVAALGGGRLSAVRT